MLLDIIFDLLTIEWDSEIRRGVLLLLYRYVCLRPVSRSLYYYIISSVNTATSKLKNTGVIKTCKYAGKKGSFDTVTVCSCET